MPKKRLHDDPAGLTPSASQIVNPVGVRQHVEAHHARRPASTRSPYKALALDPEV